MSSVVVVVVVAVVTIVIIIIWLSWFNPAVSNSDQTATHSPFPFPHSGMGRRMDKR